MDFYPVDYLKENISDSGCIRECIEQAVKINGHKRIIFNKRNWHIDEAILLHSDMEIIVDGCFIKQNDGVFDNIFRGVNLRVDEKDPYGKPLYVEKLKNVSIKGYNNAKLIGCDVNKKGYHPVKKEYEDMVGDNWGWRTFMICLSECEGIEISGLSIENTKCWALSLDLCSYGDIHDIFIQSDVKNGDGIDLRAGCRHFRIWNITGNTSDDTVACTALLHSKQRFPFKNYLYPLAPAVSVFDGDIRKLDIHDISVSDIRTGGLHHAVICLAADGLRVYNIDIKNIEDIGEGNRSATVMLYTGYGENYADNDIHDINIYGVHSRFSKYAVHINTKVHNVTVSDILQENKEGSLYEFADTEGITVLN